MAQTAAQARKEMDHGPAPCCIFSSAGESNGVKS